jgi:hypothetical protein
MPLSSNIISIKSDLVGELTTKQALLPSITATLLMTAGSLATSAVSGVSGMGIYFDYAATGASVSVVAVLIWIFLHVAAMAVRKEEEPLKQIREKLPSRLRLIILPALIFPVFLASFTTAKSAIPFVTGFGWDHYWADMDRAIFGVDPWTITHSLLGDPETRALAWFYTVAWGFAVAFSKSLIAIYADRKFVAQFFTAALFTWLIGGFVGAYALSSAGPIFAHLVDPAMAHRFDELRIVLAGALPADSPLLNTQRYLAHALSSKEAVRGGGMSAMPSMHVAAATLLWLAARGRTWTILASAFWIATFVGSVHFGYHYALDGVFGGAIAVGCWLIARAYFAFLTREMFTPDDLASGPAYQAVEGR